MELVTVYRVENDEGIGPYQSEWEGDYDMYSDHSDTETHPAWGYEEFYDKEPESELRNYYAGFDSMEKLNRWFDGYYNQLHDAGFHIAEYTVPESNIHYGKSGKQLIFKPIK